MTIRQPGWALLVAMVLPALASLIFYRLMPMAGVALGIGAWMFPSLCHPKRFGW